MPENPLPQHPDFGFFNDPGDEADELDLEYTYPQQPERLTRVTDAAEIERLRAENVELRSLLPDVDTVAEAQEIYTEWASAYAAFDNLEKENDTLRTQIHAARLAYHAAYQALITDNPWRVEAVRAGLREIGAALGVEL